MYLYYSFRATANSVALICMPQVPFKLILNDFRSLQYAKPTKSIGIFLMYVFKVEKSSSKGTDTDVKNSV